MRTWYAYLQPCVSEHHITIHHHSCRGPYLRRQSLQHLIHLQCVTA